MAGALATLNTANAQYEFEVAYTGDLWRNIDGGLKTGTRYLDNLDVKLSIDLAELWSGSYGTLFAHGLYNNSSTLSEDLVGDIQVVSNIDAPGATRLFEFWYEFGNERWSVRTGLYDLNSEFDTHETGALFTNSSHGIGAEIAQTGQNGPSIFPISSLGLRWDYRFDSGTFRAAVLDGVPGDPDDPSSNRIDLSSDDGVLMVAELDWSVRNNWRTWGGVWGYSAEFERPFGAGTSNDNRGAYFGSEWQLIIDDRDVALMFHYGIANDELNPLDAYFGVAITLTDPFARGAADQVGLAIGSASAGAPYRSALIADGLGAEKWERSWELAYRTRVNDRLAIQPIIQYVQNPSATTSIDDALLLGLRFEVTWGASW